MESGTVLRQLLRTLCHNTQWKYAVFWKLKHRSRMLLTWEDGYCDYPKPEDIMQHLPDNEWFHDMAGCVSFGNEMNQCSVPSAEYSIGLSVANMSCLLYALGEGIVGRVAFTGKHSWIFSHEFNSKFLPEYPEEWQLQFDAGIKTILLVPVVPHGVVQLGSLEMVAEDPSLVAHIKDLFSILQNVTGDSFTWSRNLLGPMSFSSPFFEDFAVPSHVVSDPMKPSQPEHLMKNPTVSDAGPTRANRMSITDSNFSPLMMIQDNLQSRRKNMQYLQETESKGGVPCIDGSARESISGVLSPNLAELPYVQNQCVDALEVTPDDISHFFFEESLHSTPQCINRQICAEQSSFLNSCEKELKHVSGENIKANSADACDFFTVEHIDAEQAKQEIGNEFLCFPADSALHEALGPTFWKGYNTHLLEPAVSVEDEGSSLSLICQTKVTEGMKLSVGESDGWFSRGCSNEEHLLDAVVGSIYGAQEVDITNRFNDNRSSSSASGQLAVSCQTQSRSEVGVLAGEASDPWTILKSCLATQGDRAAGSPTGSSLKATSILTDDVPQKMELGSAQSKRNMKSYQGTKRKGRPGDIQRPRPRDRQLIQDRFKELREIVPNGAKCSIDALLERTIKHMIFLQNVTSHAEKLKQCRHLKVSGDENQDSSAAQSQQTDGTWAFELGSDSGVCPIVVRNLDQPGHMLVEMLCEEHGFFLEIAQVIRHLELTILKGVMENRSNKIWAHFIVEASRGFQRMDIVWPLMQLLQRNNRPIPNKF